MCEKVDITNVYDIHGNAILVPFLDPIKYDTYGNIYSGSEDGDYKILYEDMFIDLGGGTTDYTDEYYGKLLHHVAGWLGYKGEIKEIELAGTRASSRTPVVNTYSSEQSGVTTLINEYGTFDGEPQFRMKNSEIEDVYIQEAIPLYTFNRFPGRQDVIWGLRCGKVEVPIFNEYGDLICGYIVVGPNPDIDRNDIVYYGYKRYGYTGHGFPSEENGGMVDHSPWSYLEVRTPDGEIRFRYGGKNRVYCYNSHGLELMPFQPRTEEQKNNRITELIFKKIKKMNEDIDILKIEQEIRKKYTNRTDKEIIDLLFNSIPHITPFH